MSMCVCASCKKKSSAVGLNTSAEIVYWEELERKREKETKTTAKSICRKHNYANLPMKQKSPYSI